MSAGTKDVYTNGSNGQQQLQPSKGDADHPLMTVDQPPVADQYVRETWSNKIQFLLGCMGFSVGLGNVWRFPYLCYRDGGGAFLVPYMISVFIGAVPMFVMEIAMGQYTGQGVITCWNMVPVFKGIGYAIQIAMFLQVTYYNVIMGWAFHYLFSSFTTVLPWSHCDNYWNTERCRKNVHAYSKFSENVTNFFGSNFSSSPELGEESEQYMSVVGSALGRNVTEIDIMMINGSLRASDPVTEYWERKVLGLSSGILELGTIRWDLALCVFLAWLIVYFCIWKGIKWTGKIMYVTTTAPYLFMFILLIRGVTLPGALVGIKYYLYPDLSKLTNMRVWYGAASQVFYSYSMCCGSLTALGSYNKFHHNFWKDSALFAFINSGTSFLAGFVIFSILGFMSHEQQVSVDQVAESGPGLAFIAYPKAVAELPGAPVWSVLFFVMLILLGLDSQFGSVEGFVVAIIDVFPKQLHRKGARELLVAVVCGSAYLLGLLMCTNGGMYVFQLFDYYVQARSVMIIALCECIAIGWVYGAQRFHEHMELMLGRHLWPHMKYCWLFITPAFEAIMVFLCFYQYSHLVYNRTYIYPMWSIICGWSMPLAALSCIPLVAIVQIVRAKGTLAERLKYVTTSRIVKRPDADEPEKNGGTSSPVELKLLSIEKC